MRPAFLVDGVTEQKFIQIVCKDRPVKVINCNGSTVAAAAIAKRVSSLIRLWGGRHFPIVVLVDRENREQSAKDFADSLLCAVRSEGINDQLIVGVADRMIENWMIADPHLWPEQDILDDVDGVYGVSRLRELLPSYDKAANGPSLLARARCSEIRRRSASFRSLADQLAKLTCGWMRR